MNQKALIESAEALMDKRFDRELNLLIRDYNEKRDNKAPVKKTCNRIQERINILLKK